MLLRDLMYLLDLGKAVFWNQFDTDITEHVVKNLDLYLNHKVTELEGGHIKLESLTVDQVIEYYDVNKVEFVNSPEMLKDPYVSNVRVERVAYVTYCDLADLNVGKATKRMFDIKLT